MKSIVHRSHFEVSFLDEQDSPLPAFKLLEQHVLAVDLGTELLEVGNMAHRTNTLIIWLADDWKSAALTAIREHVSKGNQPFKVMVKITDGTLTKDIFVYHGCALSALQHSIFTRENQDERVEVHDFRGITRINTGLIKPPAAREASAKLLQVAFATFEHHIVGIIQ